MATLLSFFRDIFGIEERVKAAVGTALKQGILLSELLTATEVAINSAIEGVAQIIMPMLLQASQAGYGFANEVANARLREHNATAVQDGINIFRINARRVGSVFLVSLGALVDQQQTAGVESEALIGNLQAQFDERTGIFGGLLNGITLAAENAVQYVANTSLQESLIESEDPMVNADSLWTWITVADNRVCPDCEKRHRQTKTMREWISLGLPKSGFSICGDRDRCIVLPESYADDSVDLNAPIKLRQTDVAKFGDRVADLVGG